jgi:hypothetical protein
MTSPFVSGAKVEKRPLGLPVTDDTQQPEATGTAAGVVHKPDEAQPEPSESAPLPEELSTDLMAIESGAHAEPESKVAPVEKPEHPAIAQEPKAVATPEPLPPTPEQPAPGAASIPQQYKEAPSTGDKTNGSIYDTENYHKPLTHPEKKKTGWMWVVWIVAILVLGAGGGAAVYYFKIF